MTLLRLVSVLFMLSLPLLAQTHDHGDHTHDHAEENHGHDHGHDHDHDDDHEHEDEHNDESVQITLWNDQFELFAEYEPPHPGETIHFIVHLTSIRDWQPRTEGDISFKQIPERGPSKTTKSESPISDGIYKQDLKFPVAGEWQVAITVDQSTFTIPVTVVADETEIPHDDHHAEDHHDDEIGLTKEQQWRMPFSTQTVETRAMRQSIPGQGMIVPTAIGEAHVITPLDSSFSHPEGKPLILGEKVRKGQLLGYLLPIMEQASDPVGLELEVDHARMESEFYREEHIRLERLFEEKVISTQQLRASELEAKRAEHKLEVAEKRLKLYQTNSFEHATPMPIHAPISGTLTAVHAVEGEFAEAGEMLFNIINLDKVWLEVDVPAAFSAQLRNPVEALFSLEGGTHHHRISPETGGRLITVGAVVESDSRMLPVIYELDNRQGHFKIGMVAEASILVGDGKPNVSVPRTALVEDQGQALVFIQTGGETFEKRWVRRGIEEGDWVQIEAGLKPGERIVTLGAYQVFLASKADVVPDHGHAH
jgi:RND family efflux transporter MFP subunit